jgi:hypothetical protein
MGSKMLISRGTGNSTSSGKQNSELLICYVQRLLLLLNPTTKSNSQNQNRLFVSYLTQIKKADSLLNPPRVNEGSRTPDLQCHKLAL